MWLIISVLSIQQAIGNHRWELFIRNPAHHFIKHCTFRFSHCHKQLMLTSTLGLSLHLMDKQNSFLVKNSKTPPLLENVKESKCVDCHFGKMTRVNWQTRTKASSKFIQDWLHLHGKPDFRQKSIRVKPRGLFISQKGEELLLSDWPSTLELTQVMHKWTWAHLSTRMCNIEVKTAYLRCYWVNLCAPTHTWVSPSKHTCHTLADAAHKHTTACMSWNFSWCLTFFCCVDM
jgi:hypothetical protein